MRMHLPFTLAALTVMSATGLMSMVVSYASVKLKGDYFILATLGLQMIVLTVLTNWTGVTSGPYGISGIPPVKVLGIWSLDTTLSMFLFTALVALLTIWFFSRLQKSPYGRMLRAVRSDDISVQTLGRNTGSLKASAFFLSSAFASLAGVLYAAHVSYISPAGFTLDESIFIITGLFIGGIGSRVRGPLAGALVIVVLPELLRFVGLPEEVAAHLRQIIYGATLVALMFFRPQGLFGDTKLK
jgi:branched-chain amino acid transport system permease protein